MTRGAPEQKHVREFSGSHNNALQRQDWRPNASTFSLITWLLRM